ncbi:MAG: ribonuclease R [Fusobacteriaceae bacterium]|jgi:ribonuclease R|nr:ribonuclease R [Fusobacteriaceae bacterium]
MTNEKGLRELQDVLASEGRGLKYTEITELLHWQQRPKKEIKAELREWVRIGEITLNRKNKYNLPDMKGLVKGVVSMTTDRYGFVDTEDEGGVFVAGPDLGSAVDGDTVWVRIVSDARDGMKQEGKVVRIIERSKNTVTGVFEKNGDFGFVVPTGSFGRDIYIPAHMMRDAKDNELVTVEIIDWGDESRKPSGQILRILGDAQDTGNMIRALIINEGLPETFPREVVEEAKAIPLGIRGEERKGRVDLTTLPIITIDGEDAKDLDDAVYVEKLINGNYRLFVSIADVSWYVREGSALDVEAYARGNSVYLVDRVLPMLPPELSNGICSLNEGEEKLTFTCRMEITPAGEVENYDLFRSVIRSARRMTYTDVNRIIAGEAEALTQYADIAPMVSTMLALSHILRKKKRANGNIDFDLPEIKVKLNEKGLVESVGTRERGEAEKLIEDFMVAANETVAEELYYAELPALYRTHEKPDPEKITALNTVLNRFGFRVSRHDDLHPKELQEIIDKSRETGVSQLIHKLILMSLKQARYTVENIGHFGLASRCYTHFTSPIRRYADLMAHRILASRLTRYPSAEENAKLAGELPGICLHISRTERIAMKAEEQSVRIKVVEYMRERVGEEFTGTIVGFSRKKIFLATEENIECYWDLVAADHFYELDEERYAMEDQSEGLWYNIGDKFPITVVRASLAELEIEVIPTALLPENAE